ncbi:unnamed protein product, partial [Sphacelaria rigidula]
HIRRHFRKRASTQMCMQPGKGGDKTQMSELQVFGQLHSELRLPGSLLPAPPPSRAATAIPAEETGDGHNGARGRSRDGRSRSTSKHARGGSTTSRGMGAASRASTAPG